MLYKCEVRPNLQTLYPVLEYTPHDLPDPQAS